MPAEPRSPNPETGARAMFVVSSGITASAFLGPLLKELNGRGWRSTVVSGPPPAELGDLAEVIELGELRREASIGGDLRAALALYRTVKRTRPDVLHYSTPKAALLGAIVSWVARVPVRIYLVRGLRYESEHGIKRFVLEMVERVACALATDVVAVSPSVQRAMVRDRIARHGRLHQLGAGGSRGVDSARFAPPTDRSVARHGAAELTGTSLNGLVVLFVGRLHVHKGIDELLEAWSVVHAAVPDAELIVAGSNETGTPALEWPAGVHYLGPVADPLPLMLAADLLVLPTHREGLPNVLLEAAACELPVLSTRATGVADVVVDGETGILVEVGDATALAAEMKTLLQDETLRRRLGRAGRHRVQTLFESGVVARLHAEHLEDCRDRQPSRLSR